MKTDEILRLIADKDFLDKIYRFSYHRCSTSFEAEDLCSEIILTAISSIRQQSEITDFYAFVWTIARRVYADFCEKRNRNCHTVSIENCEMPLVSKENEIERLIEETVMTEQLKKIFHEIAFLSKAYRDVMVMYYIDERNIKDIADTLCISETAVKQRLFSARNTIRKEVTFMNNRNLSLKPVRLNFIGTGNPCNNDPRGKAERTLSQNLIYLCKDKPKTAKELSEELCVPMPYIEEELEIQCHGENGSYGMLRRLDNGKYVTNVLLVDYSEYDAANQIYEKHLPEFCSILKDALARNQDKILSFPYLSPQKDIRFIMWSLISQIIWDFQRQINTMISETYFSDVLPVKRNFSCVAIAFTEADKPDFAFYGCDGITAMSHGGYKSVFVSNIYGARIDKHFSCGHDIANDAQLLITIKSIGGLSVKELSEAEKEVTAQAIGCGYLQKSGEILEPKIIVIDRAHEEDFYHLASVFNQNENMQGIIASIAEETAAFIRKHVPEYLLNEYQNYNTLIAGERILSRAIEECITEDILTVPESSIGAEGMLMFIEK